MPPADEPGGEQARIAPPASTAPAPIRTRERIRLATWALAVLLVDQVTKAVVYRTMSLHAAPRRVLGDVLRLTYIHNEGAAFGLFGGNRWFFVGVSLLSILVILALAGSGRYRDSRLTVAFGLILGGATGNLLDRLWLGRVIDFIEMGVAGHYWPVYNVADIGVTVGVVLLGILVLLERPPATDGVREPRS